MWPKFSREQSEEKLVYPFDEIYVFRVLLETDTGAEAAARGREAMEILNYRLCNLTQLYDYSKIFGLFEVKLAVLHCAGKYEEEIVQCIWRDLLQKGQQLINYFFLSCLFRITKFSTKSHNFGINSEEFIIHFAPSQKTIQFIAKICSNRSVLVILEEKNPHIFIEYILRELIIFCFKHSAPNHWLLEVCHGAEIPYRKLLMVASEQYRLLD